MLVPRSVGLIVIGDEILSGKVNEANSRLVCESLPPLGLKLHKISVIPDNIELISKEARDFMMRFDVVLTSGGIGPTHDDVTYEGLAKAIGEDTFLHPDLLRIVEAFFRFDSRQNPADPKARMAQIPVSSELVYGIDCFTGRQSNLPVVKIKNLYALPGIPRIFRIAFEIIKEHLRDTRTHFYSRSLFVKQEEAMIAHFLSNLAQTFSDSVSVGSYPVVDNSYYRVRVTLDSLDEQKLDAAYAEAKIGLSNALVAYEPDPVSIAVEAMDAVVHEQDSILASRVSAALHIINSAFDQFTPSQLVIGFNGGKDCTALLHLVYTVAVKRAKAENNSENINLPRLLYIRSRSVFPELETFIQGTLRFYRLSNKPDSQMPDVDNNPGSLVNCGSLIMYEGSQKSRLGRLLKDYPEVRGVFMGTRKSDPGADKLTAMCMTDPDWPPLMRINPILDWTYADVWQFIRRLSLPYCRLYDVGYTSIGSVEDTRPHPELRYTTEAGCIGYRPAFNLDDGSSERSSRRDHCAKSTSETPD